MPTARSYPGASGSGEPLSASSVPLHQRAHELDERYDRLCRRRDAPVANTPFHPSNRGQKVADRARMREAGSQLSGEYNALAMEALPVDSELALTLLQRGLAAAPKGEVAAIKTLCNLGVCCLHIGKSNAALRHL